MTHLHNQGQKSNITYSNSSLKLWLVKKYAIELISVKGYKQHIAFLMAKTLKDIRYSLRFPKVFPQ